MCYFFFNDTATTEIYTLSLHDALPILALAAQARVVAVDRDPLALHLTTANRSEEHTSELQSRQYLVCRLLLEKKKKQRLVPFPSYERCTVILYQTGLRRPNCAIYFVAA